MILLSPVINPDIQQEAKAAGFRAIVGKPLRHSHLHDVVADALWDSRPPSSTQGASEAKSDEAVLRLGDRYPLRILVAEDIPVNQRLMQLMLKKLGYTAEIVPTGVGAVEAVRHRQFDVVILDMHMPEMDGLEAARYIRQWEAENSSSSYIIALTADAVARSREKCIAAGMDDYLTKPLKADQLDAAFCRFLQSRGYIG